MQIQGVELKQLVRHCDERGYFQEIIKSSDIVGFGQWSLSVMNQGVIKAFHCHLIQWDYWLISTGVVKAVLCDLREGLEKFGNYSDTVKAGYVSECQEFLLGDIHSPQVLVIPPGIAHGLKVLQGPAHLFYITSREYDPADEGRIPFDTLGYDWFKQDIK